MKIVEKYFKDKSSVNEFIFEFTTFCKYNCLDSNLESLASFLEQEVKVRLSEDERVILKNIDTQNFKAIGRKDDYLYLRYTDYTLEYGETDIKTLTFWYMYHDLFKFIQERRRI